MDIIGKSYMFITSGSKKVKLQGLDKKNVHLKVFKVTFCLFFSIQLFQCN